MRVGCSFDLCDEVFAEPEIHALYPPTISEIVLRASLGQLSLPLVFQAKVVTSGAETLAYGQRCRISDAAVEAAKKLVDTWRSK